MLDDYQEPPEPNDEELAALAVTSGSGRQRSENKCNVCGLFSTAQTCWGCANSLGVAKLSKENEELKDRLFHVMEKLAIVLGLNEQELEWANELVEDDPNVQEHTTPRNEA